MTRFLEEQAKPLVHRFGCEVRIVRTRPRRRGGGYAPSFGPYAVRVHEPTPRAPRSRLSRKPAPLLATSGDAHALADIACDPLDNGLYDEVLTEGAN